MTAKQREVYERIARAGQSIARVGEQNHLRSLLRQGHLRRWRDPAVPYLQYLYSPSTGV